MGGGTFTFAKTDEYTYGTQYVEGNLLFTGATTIELHGDVYAVAGAYELFKVTGTVSGLEHVTLVAVGFSEGVELPPTGALVYDEVNDRVIANTVSAPTNGKQWVEGDLTFSGPMTVQLAEGTYVTKGTYELFEVTGTVTGFGNLTCVSTRGYTCTVSQVSNIIYVTLA